MKRKIISLLLCLLMALSLIPTVAFAKEGDGNVINYEKTSTLTFKIENGTWDEKLATEAGVQLSADKKTVTFPTYFHSDRIGYVYMCSLDANTATNGAVLEKMLAAILKGDYAGYIKPDTGYDAAGLSAQDWSVEQGGITGSTETANSQMNTIYRNIHGYDTHMSPVGGFDADTIYKLTLTKSSYTIKYVDGVNGAAFKTQEYTANYNDNTPAFQGTPTREGYNFTGWNPQVAEKVIKDMTYTATWEKSTGDLTIIKTLDGDGANAAANMTFTFKVMQNGEQVGDPVTITGSGSETVSLPVGTYNVVEEGAAIDGYNLTTTGTGEVEVTTNGATVPVTNTYDKITGDPVNNTATLTITKVDSVDETNLLTGAVFTLTQNDTTLTSVDNEDGTYTISGIDAEGTWTLTETTAPEGYQQTNRTWTIRVTKESIEELTDGEFVTTNTYKISGVDNDALTPAVNTHDMRISNAINWDNDKVNPASLTITKVDAEATTQKLTGAVFTLTKDGTTLTSVDNTDGTYTISGLTAGTYELKETTAPDGYQQTNRTWTIVVEKNANPTEIVLTTDNTKFQKVYDCTVYELVGDDRSELTYGLTITNEKAPVSYSVPLPIQKIVEKKAGSNDPGETTFAFVATMYDVQTDTTTTYGTAAIATNGVGTYDDELTITVPAYLFSRGNGEILLQVSEVKGTDSKWSYDDTVYIVLIQVEDYEVTRFEVNPEIAAQATDDEAEKPTTLTFTNEYSYKYTPTPLPTPPRPVTSVKTGDMGVALYAVTSLLSLSGAAVIIKKRKDEE